MTDAPRWHQRFDNFRQAVADLEEAVTQLETQGLNKLEEVGAIKQFELCWELGWKVMRDFVTEAGMPLVNPSSINAIRAGLSVNLIEDGDRWVAAMRLRNTTTHEYGRAQAQVALKEIAANLLPLFQSLREKLSDERN